jgi:N-acetylglucosaminyl transferase component (Gpi1)
MICIISWRERGFLVEWIVACGLIVLDRMGPWSRCIGFHMDHGFQQVVFTSNPSTKATVPFRSLILASCCRIEMSRDDEGHATPRTTTTTARSTTTRLSSRLLIWPRQQRRTPRGDIGLVLGWRTLETILPSSSYPSSSSSSGIQQCCQREVVVCAGIIELEPPSSSSSASRQQYPHRLFSLLHTCRQRLAKLQESEAILSSSSVTRNLEIVAIWTSPSSCSPSPSSPGAKLSKEYQPLLGLDVITQPPQGIPWWKKGNSNDSEKEDDLQYRQVVFYDVPDTTDVKTVFSHFHSDYGRDTPGNEWSMILQRLNHAQQLLDTVQTGIMLPLGGSSTDDIPVGGEESITKAPSPYQQLTTRIVNSSVTLLHLCQVYKESTVGGGRHWSYLSVFSLVRCILFVPKAPQRNHCVGGSRSSEAKAFVRTWDRCMEATLDLFLGIGMALLLVTMWRHEIPADTSLWSYYATTRRWATDSLTKHISALEDFPAGFKLNESLTEQMGYGIRHLVMVHRQWMESTLWNIKYGQQVVIPVLFMGSGLCGYNFFLAILMDMCRLETLHLWLLTRIFRSVYQTELFLLSALFRLFRGKKHNVLRQRTDSMQYDAMQLLVGTLAFCICIFLWTTIMVYYAFFVMANWIFNFPVVLVWIAYVACRSVPWGTMAWRLLRPQWFTKFVYLQSLNDANADVRAAVLRSVPESLAKLVADSIMVHITSLLSWLINGLIEVILPRNSNPAPCSLPFSQLMKNFELKAS